MFGIPLWVLACMCLLVFSGIMTVRTMRQEQTKEEKFIEREGQMYMHRMEEERKRRQSSAE
ncbi:sporulation YhaL family protein [Salimicrobium halophilum]|uniref:Sporulation protein YhaL n=1 Tax=Salimicrobium halophilum TaxID=86666 RepID=A0A1G8TN35_9BACI|nr:sporulation YhaL family protein [Salimicrobium halophilum]SDJ43006.1 Sporulation protein YhaL [Salimicrobium halophilum]